MYKNLKLENITNKINTLIFQTSSCTTEEILNLSGGGDWHTAYICVYEAKKLPIFTPDLDDGMDTQ